MDSTRHAAMNGTLRSIGRLGPFFAVDTTPGVEEHPLWRSFPELLDRALPDQIATVRASLGTVESRVAASLLFQGIAGRLWSPVLATAVLHGVVPGLDPARTYWRAASPGPILLAAPGAGTLPADPAVVLRVVVEVFLRPLVAAVRATTPVAEGLLWGNAASALAGAHGVLAAARPHHATAGLRLVRALLSEAPLDDTGDMGPAGFRRRSCCLYYRVPGGGMCGDCALL